MATDTASRLLELLALLQARRDWPGAELSERLGVARRTVRRDVERLRTLGYPVESLSGPAGGYRLRAGTALPPLVLDDDEAIAIGVGLRTATRSAVDGIEESSLRALVKLEQVLPARLRPRIRALAAVSTGLPPGGPTVDAQALTVIASGCRDSERIRFGYRSREGDDSRREVEPHALVNLGRRWYLLAWDLGRSAWRTFRADRISDPVPTGVKSAEREPPSPDAATHVAESIASAPSRHEARITLRAPIESLRGRAFASWGTLSAIDAETCELRTGDDDLDWLALRVAMIDVDFEIHEPPDLAARLEALARRIDRALGAGEAGRDDRGAGEGAQRPSRRRKRV